MKPVVTFCVLLLGLLLAGCRPVQPLPGEVAGGTAPAATATVEETQEAAGDVSAGASDPAAAAAAASLAAQVAAERGIERSAVKIVSSAAVEWPDACLGVTAAGEMCAQVITPGYEIVLSTNGETYTYHTDQTVSTYRLAEGAGQGDAGAVEAQSGALVYEGPAELGTADTSRCAKLQISGSEATVESCDGTVTTAPLSQNSASTWTDIAGRFGSFIYETASERLAFQGTGSLVDPMWQRALLAWARITRAELATGQTSATGRTAASWNLGPIPDTVGVCAHLTVLDYGYAYAERRSCEGGELTSATEDWLAPEEMKQFDRWLYTYAPLYADDSYLNGVGQEEMPADEAGAVENWAAELWTRLSGMPLAPPAGDAAAACDESGGAGQVYSSAEYGFCLVTPTGYEVVESAPGSLNLVAGGDLMNHISPRVGIEVSAAGDRTLAGIADQMMQDYAPAGTDVTTRTVTIDGSEGVLFDNLPGQDLNRRIVILHNQRVYSLMFTPLSPEAEPFFQAVLDSLRFLD